MNTYDLRTGCKPGDADQCVSEKSIAGEIPGTKPESILLSNSGFLDSQIPPNSSEKKPKCSELFNITEAVRYGILKPVIFGCLVYDKIPLVNKNSQVEKETLVTEIFRKTWDHYKLPFNKLQVVYSFQLNEGDQFHFHFVIFKKGIPADLVQEICEYFLGTHNGLGSSKVEKYKFTLFKNRGLFYLTKKPVMDPDVPISLTFEVKKALNKLKRIRTRDQKLLGHLFDQIENKRSLVAISTYKLKKPTSLVLVPQVHKHLKEYFKRIHGNHSLAVVQIRDSRFWVSCYRVEPEGSYQDYQAVDAEQLRSLRIQLSRRKDESTANLYLSPNLDQLLRNGVD